MSRPTKCSEALLKKANDYLENHEQFGDVIPSISGLARHLEVRRETIQVWKNDENKEELSNTLDFILGRQEQILLNKGLTGEFNAAICKLMLANHGYSNKRETTLSGPEGGDIVISYNGVPSDGRRG